MCINWSGLIADANDLTVDVLAYFLRWYKVRGGLRLKDEESRINRLSELASFLIYSPHNCGLVGYIKADHKAIAGPPRLLQGFRRALAGPSQGFRKAFKALEGQYPRPSG